MTLFSDLFLITVAALLGGAIAHHMQLPPLLGYIAAGVAVGPYTGGATVSELLHVETLAEIGLALLLFSLGVEFSLQALRLIPRTVLIGALIYALLSILLGLGIGMLLGWAWPTALWFGMFLSLSSAALFLKLRPRLPSLDAPDRALLSALVTSQNILILPIFLVLSQATAQPIVPLQVGLAALEAVLLLTVLLVIGTQVVPRLSSFTIESPDLHTLLVVGSAILLGAGTVWYGLPFVLVAFPIGLSFSEEVTRGPLNALLQIRGLFGVLFFVSAGMLLDPAFVVERVAHIGFLVALVAVGKGVMLALLICLFGYSSLTALVAGLVLFQVGELSLVLARIGLHTGMLNPDLYSLMVALSLITIVITPLALNIGVRLSQHLGIRQAV